MNGKCFKKIIHIFKTTYKYDILGFDITLPSCITKEGLGWKHNKSECVFIITIPFPWQSSPKAQYIVNLYTALSSPCFINPKKRKKNQYQQSGTKIPGFGKGEYKSAGVQVEEDNQ